MSIPASTLAASGAAALFCAALPVLALLLCRHRWGAVRWWPLAAGVAGFLLFSQVLGNGLHVLVLGGPQGMASWIDRAPWSFALYAALVAGVFEEAGRLAGLRSTMRRGARLPAAACFGIGWAGIEALLVGTLPQVQAVVLGQALNAGTLAQALGAAPPEAIAAIEASLLQASPGMAVVAACERTCAFVLQLSLTVWMAGLLRAGASTLGVFVGMAALHALVDLPAAMFKAGLLSLAWAEVACGVAAATLGVWALRAGRVLSRPAVDAP